MQTSQKRIIEITKGEFLRHWTLTMPTCDVIDLLTDDRHSNSSTSLVVKRRKIQIHEEHIRLINNFIIIGP